MIEVVSSQMVHSFSILPPQKVLIGISGGADSVFLAYTLRELGYQIACAHVNYQLRGEDSEADEAFVKSLATDWNVPFYLHKENPEQRMESEGLSVQIAAREIRYTFFEELMDKYSYAYCATAHHQDDQIETLLLSLVKGHRAKVWKGIPPQRGPYVRPLLSLTKKQILHALEEWGLPYRQDKSNFKPTYLRNQVRLLWTPLLEKMNPSFQELLIQKYRHHEAEQNMLKQVLQPYVSPEVEGVWVQHLDWQKFKKDWGEEHLPLLVGAQMEQWGIHGHLRTAVEGLIKGISGKEVKLSLGRMVRTAFGLSWIKSETQDWEVTLVEISEELILLPNGQSLTISAFEGKPIFHRSNEFYMDADQVQFPLKLRSWQKGDKMQPFGMQNHQLLSDVFIQQKRRPEEKTAAIIVEDTRQIICVSGFRLAEGVKITDKTQRMLKLLFNPI